MVLRISGLSSGIDVDSIVKELMKAERTKVDNVYKKRVKLEWQQEAYRTMSAAIVDFRNNKLTKYNLSSAMNAKTAEVSGNTAAVSAKASSSASTASLSVNVKEVATSATTILDFSQKIEDLGADASKVTLSELGIDVNNLSVSGVSITGLTGGSTLNDLVKQINASEANVTAISNGTGGISLTSKTTGVIEDPDDPSNEAGVGITVDLGLADSTEESSIVTQKSLGTNSEVEVNGLTYKQTSNTLTVDGITLSLKEKSNGTASTITTTTDTSAIVDTIKSFISDYNSLLEKINTALGEEKYSKYLPLTDDEESEMTESQVELWNEKAKSGLLRNDSILSNTVSNLRTSAISSIGGINITDIGITTGTWEEKGKLILDEEKLAAAIEADPDQVASLFMSNSSSGKGIFNQMSSVLMTSLEELSEKAGTSMYSTSTSTSFLESSLLSTQINELEDKEDYLNDWLTRKENSYYTKFTAMETAISKYNSISSSLTGLFS